MEKPSPRPGAGFFSTQRGRTIFGCPILSRYLSAKRAAEGARISGPIGIGNCDGARVADRGC
jgi:hypothetical protein